MSNNNVAIVSLMAQFDEKSVNVAAEKLGKTTAKAFKDIGKDELSQDIVSQFTKAMNTVKGKLKGVNLSSYTNNILDSIISDKDIAEKIKELEDFISNIKALSKSLSGLDSNALNSMNTKQLDAIINKQKKIEKKNEEIINKTKSLNSTANSAARTERSTSSLVKKYGVSDYEQSYESLKKVLQTNDVFNDSQKKSIKHLSEMLSLYSDMEKVQPEKGTKEAISYSVDLLTIVKEIQKTSQEIDLYTSGKASKFVNKNYDSMKSVNEYNVESSKSDFVKSGLSTLQTQKAKLEKDLTEYIGKSVEKNLQKMTDNSEKYIDSVTKKAERLQTTIDALSQQKSDKPIVDNIVDESQIKSLEEIEDRLLDLQDKYLETDANGYAVNDLDTKELKEFISLYNEYTSLLPKDNKFESDLPDTYKSIIDSDEALQKYADSIQKVREEKQKLEDVKGNTEVDSSKHTEELKEQQQQIEKTEQAEKDLQETHKASSNTIINVDTEQALSNINAVKESLESLPSEKNIKISVNNTDYSSVPLLSNEEGKTVNMFRGIKNAWSGLVNDKGIGFFTDKLELAVDYADELAKDGKVIQANLALHNPLEVEGNGARWDQINFEGVKQKTDDIIEKAKQLGYDGVIFKNIRDGFTDTETDLSNVVAIFDAMSVKNEQVVGVVKAGTGELTKIESELKETQVQAENTVQAIKEVTSVSQESNISSDKKEQKYYQNIANELTNIKDRHEGTHLIVEEIGKSESEILSIIRAENDEIKKGNELWKERQFYTDSKGNVVSSYKGDKNEIGLGKASNINIGNPTKETHIHPYNEDMAGSYSIGDVYNMHLAFAQGIRQFEFKWRDEILSLDFSNIDDKRLLSMADNYEDFFAGVNRVMHDVYETNNDFAINRGTDLKNSYLAELVEKRGGTAKLYTDNYDGTKQAKNFVEISNAERTLIGTTAMYAIKLSELNEGTEEYNRTVNFILKNRKQLVDYYQQIGLLSQSSLVDANSLKDQTSLVQKFTQAFREYITAYEDYYGGNPGLSSFGIEKAGNTLTSLEKKYPELKSVRSNGYVNTSDDDLYNKALNEYLKRQDKLQSELKETEIQAEQTSLAVKEVITTTPKEDLKDAFPSSSTDTKPEAEGMQEVEKITKEAVQSKKDFATANEGVQSSIDGSKSPLQLEAELMDQIAKSAREAADAKKEFVEANKQVKNSADDNDSELDNNHEKKKQDDSDIQKQKDAFNKSNLNAIDMEIKKREEEAKINSSLLKSQMEQQVQYENQLKKINSTASSYRNDVNRYKKDSGKTGYIATNNYLQKIEKYESQVKSLESYVSDLHDQEFITDEQLNKLEVLKKRCEEAKQELKDMKASDKGSWTVDVQKEIDKINSDLSKNSNYSKQAKEQLKAFVEQLKSGNISDTTLKAIHEEFLRITNAEKLAGREGKNFFDIVSNSRLHQIAAQIAGMFSIYDVINAGREAVSIVTELNTQITELAKVSEQSSSQIYADFDSYSDIAKEVRGTISDTIAATADWSKNGYSIPDSKQLAEISQLYKNVGDGINIDEANESLISTLKGFQLEADQAEHIVDVFNEVSNNEAISSGGIGDALQRSAASFNAASTSLEKSVSLVTATNSVLQNPEKVGNMWRTVSARLRGKIVPIYSENYSLCTC